MKTVRVTAHRGGSTKAPENTLAALRQEQVLPQCLLTSMNATALVEARRWEPSVPTGLILTAPGAEVTTQPVDVLSGALDCLTAEWVKGAHDAGKEVHEWTVNRPQDMRRMIAWGVDNIITDRPDLLRLLLPRGILDDRLPH